MSQRLFEKHRNVGFKCDADLKRRNAEWGLRHVEDFVAAADKGGFRLLETRAMPANNMMLLLRRR